MGAGAAKIAKMTMAKASAPTSTSGKSSFIELLHHDSIFTQGKRELLLSEDNEEAYALPGAAGLPGKH